MIKVEYKKINYIFSINNCVEDNIRKLSLTDETIQFIKKLKIILLKMVIIQVLEQDHLKGI